MLWLPPLLEWAVLNARFAPDIAACEALDHRGACWGVVAEKARFILLGRYPADEAWRSILAAGLIAGSWLGVATGVLRGRSVIPALALPPLVAITLLGGGLGGLQSVPTELWGGLPLTLLLTAAGMAGALPLGIAVAYGRRSSLPVLRGPRGGMILCKAEHAKAIDKAVFPMMQGGPLMHAVAAKAVALKEAATPGYQRYAANVIANAQALAAGLAAEGMRPVSGGTDTHLALLDLQSLGVTGTEAEQRCDAAAITLNKNAIPYDPGRSRSGRAGAVRGRSSCHSPRPGAVFHSDLRTGFASPRARRSAAWSSQRGAASARRCGDRFDWRRGFGIR